MALFQFAQVVLIVPKVWIKLFQQCL